MAQRKKVNGAILWRGPSEIDGSPIVLIVTGLAGKSSNDKTGNMIQTWILREDIKPTDAVNSGQDSAICGDCVHRGEIVNGRNVKRSCYVLAFMAPNNIYKTMKRDVYQHVSNGQELFERRAIRLGAYGDPAAIPFEVWASLLSKADSWTGYTHLHKTCDSRFARYCMASADSESEGIEARSRGYRTFRVGTPCESPSKGHEFLCPASNEAGNLTNCATCKACAGTSARNKASVFIPAHGAGGRVKNFTTKKESGYIV